MNFVLPGISFRPKNSPPGDIKYRCPDSIEIQAFLILAEKAMLPAEDSLSMCSTIGVIPYLSKHEKQFDNGFRRNTHPGCCHHASHISGEMK